jgi:hypothetical protein
VTSENVNELIAERRNVIGEGEVHVVSIDIDGLDFYIWAALRVRAQVVVIEYNSFLTPNSDFVQAPDSECEGCGGNVLFGAGGGALAALGSHLGYTLVYAETRGVNLFFVRDDLIGRLRSSWHIGSVARTLELVRWRPCYAGASSLHATHHTFRWLSSLEALHFSESSSSTTSATSSDDIRRWRGMEEGGGVTLPPLSERDTPPASSSPVHVAAATLSLLNAFYYYNLFVIYVSMGFQSFTTEKPIGAGGDMKIANE